MQNFNMKNANATINKDMLGMMQIIWQMGEKFGKMEIKMDELKKENEGLKNEIAKMKEELNDNPFLKIYC